MARRHAIPEQALAQLTALTEELRELERRLSDPACYADPEAAKRLALRKAAIEPIVALHLAHQRRLNDVQELRDAVEGDDPELAELAKAELPQAESALDDAAKALLDRLATAEQDAVGAVILEVRAGVGGDEATLWARDLLEMYERLAARRGWSFEPLDVALGAEAGGRTGVKTAVVSVQGPGAFSALSLETGTHCVKRVPATEAQGRVHTSTATVAALPEPEEVQLRVDPADVEEHITTARGPGGQNVNKVATAVHLIHRPTGLEVRMQEAKSQRQNRDKAWRLLRARLYELELERQERRRAQARSSQIGHAQRSERVRTYRYKENVAVDHRLASGENTFSLQAVLAGELDELHDRLRAAQLREKLASGSLLGTD